MEAAGALINHTPRQRGAGLGSDTRHDVPGIDLLLTLFAPHPLKPLLAHKCQRPASPVDSTDNV